VKGYKYKKHKYEYKLESQSYDNFKLPTEQDMNIAMAEMLVLTQMIKIKKQKTGEAK